jgi:hypothetical protein
MPPFDYLISEFSNDVFSNRIGFFSNAVTWRMAIVRFAWALLYNPSSEPNHKYFGENNLGWMKDLKIGDT